MKLPALKMHPIDFFKRGTYNEGKHLALRAYCMTRNEISSPGRRRRLYRMMLMHLRGSSTRQIGSRFGVGTQRIYSVIRNEFRRMAYGANYLKSDVASIKRYAAEEKRWRERVPHYEPNPVIKRGEIVQCPMIYNGCPK